MNVLFFVLVVVGWHGIKSDLCNLESCYGQEHIDCAMPDGTWGADCPAEKNMLNLTSVKDQIVALHNEYRNSIAGGNIPGFDPAKRMATFQWNINMANVARKNVRQCKMLKDGCRNLPEFNFVGQNLAQKTVSQTSTATNISIILDLIAGWWKQIGYASMNDLYEFTGESEKGNFEMMSQMAKSYAYMLGCAVAVTHTSTTKTFYLACNYNLGNFLGWPTYDNGTAASGCKTGPDKTYKNLCSTSEVFNVNTFWEDYQ